MGLFDSVMELLGMGDAPPARDLSLGDADAARYMAAVRKANFSGVDAEVGAMRDGAWDDRDFLTEIVAEQALEGLQGPSRSSTPGATTRRTRPSRTCSRGAT